MGDIKRRRKTYATPNHPWNKDRIEQEVGLVRAYGLKNKREVWKATSILRDYRAQARRLASLSGEQADRETVQLLTSLRSYGILGSEAGLDDVLTLTVNDILDRRLQTIVYRKGLAKSMRQARQFITHEHIAIGEGTITAPGHLVTLKEQEAITVRPASTLANPEHPERRSDETLPAETPPASEEPIEAGGEQ